MTIQELIRSQDGLITRDQARAAGMSRKTIETRLARRDWVRVRPAVFLSCEHRLTVRTRIRADMLWLGPDATLVGAGAAWWWRLIDTPPARSRVAVRPSRHLRGRADLVVERREIAPDERVVVDGIVVSVRAVAVVDAARELGVAAGADLMDRALLNKRVTLDGLRGAHRKGFGRPGAAVVATLVRLATGGARFEAERRLHALLRAAGIAGWVANHPVTLPRYGSALLDIAFLAQRVVVEVDGWAFHRDLEAFRRDPRRQNDLATSGWTVLRVTWHELVTDPDGVLAVIEAALDRDRRNGSTELAC